MKLYYAPGACSLASHIVLCELGLPYTLDRVDLRAKTTSDGRDFRQINPLGYIPALELNNGQVLTEGAAILFYLADLVPSSGLVAPAGELARYQTLSWINFIVSELHKNFSPLFAKDTPDDYRAKVVERLTGRLGHVNATLAAQPFLGGDTFTVADAYLFVVLGWAPKVGIDLAPFPALQAFRAGLLSRPAIQKAMQEEGLL